MTTNDFKEFVKLNAHKIVAIYCDNDKVAFYRNSDLLEEDIVEIGECGYFISHETMLRDGPTNGRMDVRVDSYIPIECVQGFLVVEGDDKTAVDEEYLYRC